MPTLSIRLETSIASRLDRLAKRTGRTKTFYITQAIEDRLEDMELLYLAEMETIALKSGKSKALPLDEVERRLGLVG